MTTTRTAETSCPYCKAKIDSASPARNDESTPDPGDCTMCLYCGEWLVFEDGLTLRIPTDDELVEIGLDPDCRRTRAAWVLISREVAEGKV